MKKALKITLKNKTILALKDNNNYQQALMNY